ncbi:MAG: hypothetical protein A2915_04225 [Candidatus Yanofskybacteria bacterium RIFCSPLOWO2_01_FULL_41_34]|uniref:Uncharacterized protein n=1 Tax=Candidatus Yanofskybacteria bacterium RIFCSPHIGHO2_01_FULL_41_26 TaxID=1802661 RepID=A0A1F8EBW8_9BACT|nr:MAG: hypothetical protein A2649_03325 [Candidatus Yanofskybacteria bacterium RIFCSPHIGHO2_01_FULL_41_26]OGN21612.1 MAG: hypothetical protein A2915_04225 [Candidatus Yanofskybacteria bacterium RIFCSPLOWO2_01_FULL_41_34]
MAEIKEFRPSIKRVTKPEKPADVVDFEQAKKKEPFVFPDTESEELMETISGLIQKLFQDSTDKKRVVEQLRNLTNNLEQKLKK